MVMIAHLNKFTKKNYQTIFTRDCMVSSYVCYYLYISIKLYKVKEIGSIRENCRGVSLRNRESTGLTLSEDRLRTLVPGRLGVSDSNRGEKILILPRFAYLLEHGLPKWVTFLLWNHCMVMGGREMLKSPQKKLILSCSWLQALVTWSMKVSSTFNTEKEARTIVR